MSRSLINNRTGGSRSILNIRDDTLTQLTATSPLEYDDTSFNVSTTFTPSSITAMSNKTISDELHGSNNTETYIDFNHQYGFPIYGYYLTGSLRSYNMAFKNTQTSSTYPYIGVSNAGDMVLHINGVGDAMNIKADRDININVGDLIGDTTGPTAFGKKRMKDIFCRHLYSEALVISNGTASSGYSLYYEDESNGNHYTKLEAQQSLASSNTITLPTTTGTLLNTAINQTLNYPLFTKTTGDNPIFAMRDEDLSHWIYMKTPALSSDIEITFPSTDGGTLALTSDLTDLTTAYMFGTNPSVNVYIGKTGNSKTTTLQGSSVTITTDAGDFTMPSMTGALASIYEVPASSANSSSFGTNSSSNITLGRATKTTSIIGSSITLNNGVEFTLGSSTGELAITTAIPTTSEIASQIAQQIGEAENVATTTIIGSTPTRTFGNTNCDATIQGDAITINGGTSCAINATTTITGESLILSGGASQAGVLQFMEDTDGGTNKILIKPHSQTFLDYQITLPSAQGQLALKTDIVNVDLDTAISYSSTAPSTINFGNATSHRTINFKTNDITQSSGDTNCNLNLTCGTGSSSSFASKLAFYIKNNTKSAEIFKNTDDYFVIKNIDERIQIGGNNAIQLTIDLNGIDGVVPLTIYPTNTASFYICKMLASSIVDTGWVEMVLGQSNTTKNTATIAYYHSAGTNDNNLLALGMKGQEQAITIKANGTTTITNGATTNQITAINTANNTIVSNSTYGWEITGNNATYSFALKNGTSNFMYLGSPSATDVFQQHINGIGNSYELTSGRLHKMIGEYFSANATSLNGASCAMGFTTFLANTYTASRFPCLATNGAYLYVSTYNNIGTRSGGQYCGYIGGNGFVDISDKKFKKDITTITNPFDIINNIRGVNFKWNEESGKEDGKNHIGFIAQELNEVIPEVCNYDDKTESWGIFKADINAVLVEGMKELQKQIDKQQEQIDKLLDLIYNEKGV